MSSFSTPGNDHQQDTPHRRIDRRVDHLVELARSTNVNNRLATEFASDPNRTILLEKENGVGGSMFTGVVMYSMPFAHWYRVHLTGRGGVVGCTTLCPHNLSPMGPRATQVIPPYSRVMVWMQKGSRNGLIVGVYPAQQHDPRLLHPDQLVQAGGTGEKTETIYRDMFTRFYRSGGAVSYNSSRPHDATTLDWGMTTETGIALNIDPFMAMMRVSEVCGLWMSYFDNFVRLYGHNMDTHSAVESVEHRDDEGELQYTRSISVYPWENIGLYGNEDSTIATTSELKDVQYDGLRAETDTPEDEDLQPIARWQEFGGYLGQGWRRQLMLPANKTGKRTADEDPKANPDMGVFLESVALDGSYLLASARQLQICKRVLIPVPRRVQVAEAQVDADNARDENYRPSGEGTAGDEHAITLPTSDDPDAHILATASPSEAVTYAINFQSVHPFHYHANDYAVPEEADIAKLPRADGAGPKVWQDKIDFSQIAQNPSLPKPTSVPVSVDARYGNVDYVQREAGISLLPDGGIVLYDGYGAQITLSGGNIRIDCPGDIQVNTGRNVVAFAGRDIVLRANNSADVTAGNGNVTVKAEKNLMLLGGNKSGGCVMIESKAPGLVTDFENKAGEEVVGGGILLKAAKSGVVTWAGQVYTRTGSDDGSVAKGPIVFDAARGNAPVVVKADAMAVMSQQGLSVFVGPRDDNSTVKAAYSFASTGCAISKPVVVDGALFILDDVAIDGSCLASSGYATIKGAQMVAKVKAGNFFSQASNAKQQVADLVSQGSTLHGNVFSNGLYVPGRPGNETVIQQAGFSFRDDPDGRQYRTDGFAMIEPRWMQMSRTGMASGGETWIEPVVEYQNRETMPYPGKTAWDGANLWRAGASSLLDISADGTRSTDRAAGAYVDFTPQEWDKVSLADNLKHV